MDSKISPREQWTSKLGFILAAAGSAVGLGNLWGFAYRSSQGGGAAFVLLYILIVLIVIAVIRCFLDFKSFWKKIIELKISFY